MRLTYFLLFLSLTQTGCGIRGYWMNGDPFYTPNIKPYIAYWHKDGMTEESRQSDSWECGAGKTAFGADNVRFSKEQAKEEMLSVELDDIAARERLRDKWITCMEAKGYRYSK